MAWKRYFNDCHFSVLIDFAFVGCLESGYYGPDCSIPCPDPHCRYCHLETGVCQGCQPGYKGHKCEGNLLYYKYIFANSDTLFKKN